MDNSDKALNGAKLVGEAYLPGSSLLIDGDILGGGAYAAAGFVAGRFFGLPGKLFVAGESFTRSVAGKGLVELVADTAGKAVKGATEKVQSKVSRKSEVKQSKARDELKDVIREVMLELSQETKATRTPAKKVAAKA
ncbi:MAG: DUF6072 family protein [Verrucomicrobiota bacterium]